MNTLMETVRSALRSFRRRKVFVLTTILLLSLALAATSIMFTLVDSVLLRALPFADPERLAWLTSVRPDRDDAPFAMPDYRDLRDRNRSTEELAAIARWSAVLSDAGPTDRLSGVRVSSNLFHLLGVRAEVGRLLIPADDDQPDSRVVVISHTLWRTRFGGDRSVIGRSITLDNRAYLVVGVLPPAFQLPVYRDAALMAPLTPEFHPWRADRNSVNFLSLLGRLRSGVTLQQAQSEMTGIARQLASEFPEANGRKLAVKTSPLLQQYTGKIKNSLLILLAAVVMVLFIACANLASLVLIQLASREEELAIRAALGATRSNIVRQLTAENLILALIGGLLAFVLTRATVPVLIRFLPTQIPRANEITVATPVFLFSLAMAALSALLFGALPALQWQTSSARQLGSARSSTTSVRSTHLRNAIGAGQVAVCVILLISAVLLSKSFFRLQNIDLGFDPAGVLTARISLPALDYKTRTDVVRFSESFRTNFASTQGVASLGMVSTLPLSGILASTHFSPGEHVVSQGRVPEAQFRVATPGYFRAMNIAIDGRDFAEQDSSGSEAVVIVNRELASRFWPDGKALGARLTFEYFGEDGQRTARIIGVVSNVKQFTLDELATFDVYIPLRQMNEAAVPWFATNHFWIARTAGAPDGLRGKLRQALNRTDHGAGASDVAGMDWYVNSALGVRRFNLALIAAFGVVSLLLAILGVYGVFSYTLALRSREIGTRLALGASPGQIIRMVMAQAARLIIVGLAVGTVSALGVTQTLRSLLFGVRATDATVFSSVSLFVFVVALLSCVIPAIRASRTNPLAVLRAG